MAITLARVDDRVIHGQTMTRWVAQRGADSIIVISDAVASDSLRVKVLKAAAGNIKFGVFSIQQGIAALEKVHASDKRFFIISDTIKGFADLTRLGADYGGVLNIGNYSIVSEGARNLGNAFLLNESDVRELDYLASQGIDIQFQAIPDDAPKSWAVMKEKYNALG